MNEEQLSRIVDMSGTKDATVVLARQDLVDLLEHINELEFGSMFVSNQMRIVRYLLRDERADLRKAKERIKELEIK
jgi:hypothetical protein